MTVGSSLDYGKRLIPQILDRLASENPDCIVYSLASFPGDSPKFRHISATAFAKAVDKTAWWLHKHVNKPIGALDGKYDLGQEGKQHEVPKIQPLGYIGPRKWKILAENKAYD